MAQKRIPKEYLETFGDAQMRYCSLHALTRKSILRGRRLVGEQYGIPREMHMHEVHFHIASPPFVGIHIPSIQRLQYTLCLVHAYFTR